MQIKIWTGQFYHGCEILNPLNQGEIRSKDQFLVKCHCGKRFVCIPNRLQSGNTKSCGCIQKEYAKTRMTKLRNEENPTLGRKRVNYHNYITKSGITILNPVDNKKSFSYHYWNAKCYCGKLFVGKPNNIISNLKSCGCDQYKRFKDRRLEVGLDEHEHIIDFLGEIRVNIIAKIRNLVYESDGYTCSLCLKESKFLEVHHIEPMKDQKFNTELDFKPHDQSFKVGLNVDVQKYLKEIVKMRFISNEIKNKLNHKILTEIEPWIQNYLSAKTTTNLL